MIIPQVQLWLGERVFLTTELHAYLADFFLQKGLNSETNLIKMHTHPLMRWISPPEKGAYKRADLEPIMAEVERMRGEGEPLVIILEQVNLLNDTCAHSLLKVLEEPPAYIYFLLCAPDRDFVLPTIVSRTVIVDKRGMRPDDTDSALVALFCRATPPALEEVSAVFEPGKKFDDPQVGSVMDQLLTYWQEQYKQASIQQDKGVLVRAERVLNILLRMRERPPMPGSAKIFWRNLCMFLAA